MRQWLVPTECLCRKHLLGEHVEHHMFVGTILKKKSLKGYLRDGFVQIHSIVERHEELVKEMKKRGFNHQSALPDFQSWEEGKVNIEFNLNDLSTRCCECRERIKKHHEKEFQK